MHSFIHSFLWRHAYQPLGARLFTGTGLSGDWRARAGQHQRETRGETH